jgi:Bacterial protein of unknown function (DUF853)
MNDPSTAVLANDAGHILVAGASGTGKTVGLKLICEAKLQDPSVGLHVVDPEGELSQHVLECIANPVQGLHWRKTHYFRAASTTHTFGIPLLHVRERTPLACHEAAIRARTVFEQVLNFGAVEYGPRLSKLMDLGLYGLGLIGQPPVHLPDLYTLGAGHLRALVGDTFPYQFMSEEWRSLDVLGERNPARYLEYTESLTSRLLPIFGNPRLRRIYGQAKGADIAELLADPTNVVLLDLAGLEHKDAVLVGKSYLSVLYHEALQRPVNTAPRACVMIDEVFDYVSVDLARGFDRLRKRNIQLVVCIQRLGQLQ